MLESIRTFLAVVDLQNFSAVAVKRGVAVSSVTRKIDTLEAELGIKLFRRSSRLITLTDAGEQFLPSAKRIVQEMDEAKHSLEALNDDPRGLLTVTAPASFGRRYVAPAVARFLKHYPLIEIDLHVSDQRVDLMADRVDVAIRIGALPDSDLVATRIASFRRIACASPAYIAQHGCPTAPEALLQHNCLSVASKPVPTGWWCFEGVNRNAALAVRGSLRTNDTESLLQAALEGIGIVHLGSWLVHDLIKSGRLVALFAQAPAPAHKALGTIHAVHMPGRSHPVKAQLLIAHLKSEIGAPAIWDRDG